MILNKKHVIKFHNHTEFHNSHFTRVDILRQKVERCYGESPCYLSGVHKREKMKNEGGGEEGGRDVKICTATLTRRNKNKRTSVSPPCGR